MTPLVLIVDDDPAICSLMTRALAKEGLDASAAHNVAAALALIAARRPDAVLLDLGLPDADGRDLLASLKADARTEDIPVILVTGCVNEYTRQHGIEMGALDYVLKPFRAGRLARRVRHMVEKRADFPPVAVRRMDRVDCSPNATSAHDGLGGTAAGLPGHASAVQGTAPT